MDVNGAALGGELNQHASGRALHPGMSFREFVACIAMIQATVALAIDMMIPALARSARQCIWQQPMNANG